MERRRLRTERTSRRRELDTQRQEEVARDEMLDYTSADCIYVLLFELSRHVATKPSHLYSAWPTFCGAPTFAIHPPH